jgi:hypothetical protein
VRGERVHARRERLVAGLVRQHPRRRERVACVRPAAADGGGARERQVDMGTAGRSRLEPLERSQQVPAGGGDPVRLARQRERADQELAGAGAQRRVVAGERLRAGGGALGARERAALHGAATRLDQQRRCARRVSGDLRELGGQLRRAVAELGQRPPGQLYALGRQQLAQDGVARERVAEVEVTLGPLDELGLHGAPKGGDDVGLGQPGHRSKQPPPEALPEQRGGAHDGARRVAEAVEPLADGLRERPRHHAGDVVGRQPPRAGGHERPGARELGEELLHQERQPIGARAQQRQQRLGHLL